MTDSQEHLKTALNDDTWAKLVQLFDGLFAKAVVDYGLQDCLFASIATSSADNTLVAAVANKKIRAHAAVLVGMGNCTARFESGTGGTALTGQMNFSQNDSAVIAGANGVLVLPYSPAGWFQTASGALLNLEIGGSGDVRGCLVYRLVD